MTTTHQPYIIDNAICVASRGRNTAPDGSIEQHLELCPEPGKTNCLTTVSKDNLILESVCLTTRRTEYGKAIRRQYEAHEIQVPRSATQQLEPRTDGKTNTITTVQKDNLIIQLNPSKESNGGRQPYQQNRVYHTEGKTPALCEGTGGRTIKIAEATKKGYVEVNPGECFNANQPKSKTRRGRKIDDGAKTSTLTTKGPESVLYEGIKNGLTRIRRLTPTECARLQTIPDWYKWVVSETQQYRMLGNGWTVEVIKHIFSFLPYHLKQ